MNGYREAQDFDEKINELLVDFKITEENCLEWLKFSRTLKTSCDVIEFKALDVWGKQKRWDQK